MAKIVVHPHIEAHIRKYAGKQTPRQMAAALNQSISIIYNTASVLGIDLTLDEVKERWKRIDRAIAKHYGKIPVPQIAKKINEKPATIWGRIYRMNNKEADQTQSPGKNISKVVDGVELFNYKAYDNWLAF